MKSNVFFYYLSGEDKNKKAIAMRLLTLIFSLFLILTLIGCSDNTPYNVNVKETKKNQISEGKLDSVKQNNAPTLSKGEIGSPSAKVEPMRSPDYWKWKVVGPFYEQTLDHYEPVPGKIVGIWADYGAIPMSELKTRYGFTGITVTPWSYDAARNAGFETKIYENTCFS